MILTVKETIKLKCIYILDVLCTVYSEQTYTLTSIR